MKKPERPAGSLPIAAATLLAALLGVPGGLAAQAAFGQDLAAPAVAYRAPYLPTHDTDVLEQVPAASDPGVRAMATLRTQWLADPTNLKLAAPLARAYIDFGRRVGDARYAGYAEAVIAPWMAMASPEADVLVLQATILQFRHQFVPARKLLTRALAKDPHNVQAWLTQATLDMVQGRMTEAAADCAETGRYGGFVLNLACTGSLRSRLGQARQSLVLLAQIEGDIPGATPDFKAWVQGLLAESHERLGEWDQAEVNYRKALRYTPDDNFLLVAYADFLLDRGRATEVPRLLAVRQQSDTAFLRIALAQAALGSPDAGRYTWLMAARFAALTERGDDYFGREQVRFALHLQHDPQGALQLAQQNWGAQREPWDARVFLEAAQAAQQPQAAQPVLLFVQQTGLEDPTIQPLVRSLKAAQSATRAAP